VGLVQLIPWVRLLRQMFASQKNPLWQVVSLAQAVPQEVPMQTPPPGQVRDTPERQVPTPSQVLAAVSVVP
jgi:hypothetical protein